MNHNALSFVIVEHLGMGSYMESTVPSFVHITNAIDAMNGCTRGEIWALHMLHIFTHVDCG